MDLLGNQFFRLIAAVILGTIVLITANRAPMRVLLPALILLLPFPLVSASFGTINVYLILLVGVTLIFRGEIRYLPMMAYISAILFAYLLSLSQVHKSTYIEHAPYIISLVSCFFLFFIVYNFVLKLPELRLMVHVLLALNVLVIFYNILQVTTGFGGSTTLLSVVDVGISEIRQGRQPRLTGPFGAGLTAEYMVICSLIIAYELMYTARSIKTVFLLVLLGANLACLVATGNRGGLLVLSVAAPLFLFLFRAELGWKKIVISALGGSVLITIMSVIVINYTQFDSLYERLSTTTIEGGIPDTRQGIWPKTIEKIQNKPILGHGPQLKLTFEGRRKIPGHEPMNYPHNLYLFLLYTVGIVGFTAFMSFFVGVFVKVYKASRTNINEPYVTGLLKLGTLIIVVFIVDQVKVEFLRISIVDYWHFIFCLLAVFVALADRVSAKKITILNNNLPVN